MRLEELLKDEELKMQVETMCEDAVSREKEEWTKKIEQEKQDMKSNIKSDYEEKRRVEGLSEGQKLEEALLEKERLLKENNRILLAQQSGKELANRGLPVEFAEFLVGEDEQDTLSKILLFEKHFFSAVNSKLRERIPGYTPGKGTNSPDPFLMGFAGIGGNNG